MKRKWKNYTTRKGMEKKAEQEQEEEEDGKGREEKKALLFPKIAVHNREVFTYTHTHYRKWTSREEKNGNNTGRHKRNSLIRSSLLRQPVTRVVDIISHYNMNL